MDKFLVENKLFSKITSGFERSPIQANKLLESDAEIISLKDGTFLAITLDGIVEEIHTGLYKDSYLLGWMTVMASISDLAAVGASPLGLLLLENIPKDFNQNEFNLIQKGIQDACHAAGTFVLGGDTNNSQELQLGSAAIGIIDDDQLISRIGCQEKDLLFVSNFMGLGMGFAYHQLFGEGMKFSFKPLPNTQHGQLIRKFASSCIDSSDGFFSALCNLMELNSIGFRIEVEFKDFIHRKVNEIVDKEGIPDWFFLAGPHGEFELVFTIPQEQLKKFLDSALQLDWKPLLIGSVIRQPSFIYTKDDAMRDLDIFSIANLFEQSGGNPKKYFEELYKMNQLWQEK